jgi:hypothetical protein
VFHHDKISVLLKRLIVKSSKLKSAVMRIIASMATAARDLMEQEEIGSLSPVSD